MSWVYLLLAIGFEVAGTLSLKVATTTRPPPTWRAGTRRGYRLAITPPNTCNGFTSWASR